MRRQCWGKVWGLQSVRRIDEIIEQVLAAVNAWPQWAEQAGLCEFRAEQVADEMPGRGI